MHPQCEQDAQWAAVSRVTQMDAACRAEQRRHRAAARRRRLRLGAALLLVRLGLRIAGPLTLERLIGSH